MTTPLQGGFCRTSGKALLLPCSSGAAKAIGLGWEAATRGVCGRGSLDGVALPGRLGDRDGGRRGVPGVGGRGSRDGAAARLLGESAGDTVAVGAVGGQAPLTGECSLNGITPAAGTALCG